MSRRIIVTLAAMATLAFAIVAPTASAATTAAAPTVAPFTLSVDNNVVVHKDAPNLQFTIYETNNTGSPATCAVYIPELDFWTSAVTIASDATTGVGAPFPTDKHSTLTYQMVCDDVLVATKVSKVTMTGQAG